MFRELIKAQLKWFANGRQLYYVTTSVQTTSNVCGQAAAHVIKSFSLFGGCLSCLWGYRLLTGCWI